MREESELEPATDAILEALADAERGAALLERAGEPEPPRALRALARARELPELAQHERRWIADVVRAARPAYALESLRQVAETHRDAGATLQIPAAPSLVRVLGASNFLARLLTRDADLLRELAPAPGGDAPEPPGASAPDADWEAVRAAKYRGLLRIAARDLCGRDTRGSLRELSDLADACLAAALACAADETGGEAPALLALGKLGGRELNFSSDVDLLFVYEAPGGEAGLARNQEVARLVRALRAGLEGRGSLGFGYRVDLDLRPEGRAGALANSVDGALSYYESFGAEWERQALVRLRPVAGSSAGQRFADAIAPFVYRRAISTTTLHDVRAMKLRIESERRAAGRDLESDLKEGPGGIRDVEFLAQALQLLVGGREPAVRTGNVPDALEALAEAGALPAEIAEALVASYLWLRRAEHATQLAEERQTHGFPTDAEEQVRLARRMGHGALSAGEARSALLDDWTAVRAEVRAHFDALLPEAPE